MGFVMVVGGLHSRRLAEVFCRVTLCALLGIALWAGGDVVAPTNVVYGQSISEDKVRAAILYKLPLFCTWPVDGSRTHFTMLFIGQSRAYDFLKPYEGKPIKGIGKPLKLIRVKQLRDGDSLVDSDVVYVSRDQSRHYKRILSHIAGPNVLTVGEDHWFTRYGGVMDIRTVGQRMRWSINKLAAQNSKLLLNAQLYRNAHEVIAPEGGTK